MSFRNNCIEDTKRPIFRGRMLHFVDFLWIFCRFYPAVFLPIKGRWLKYHSAYTLWCSVGLSCCTNTQQKHTGTLCLLWCRTFFQTQLHDTLKTHFDLIFYVHNDCKQWPGGHNCWNCSLTIVHPVYRRKESKL